MVKYTIFVYKENLGIYLMSIEFERINRLPTYVFQEVNDFKSKIKV